MKPNNLKLILILVLVVAAAWVIQSKPTNLGLDLKGGVRLLAEAVPTKDVPKITPEVMNSLQNVIDKRLNPTGTEENLVQKVGEERILVEIPGDVDPEKAKQKLGKTGNLEFKAFDPQTGQYVDTGLSGKDLKEASAAADDSQPGTGKWMILLSFNNEGTEKFFQITRKLAPAHGRLGIFFDNSLKSAPSVNEPIPNGDARITGGFQKAEAEEIVGFLKAGALPVNVRVIEESTVGPTLGQASLEKSIKAGLIGIAIVMIFMLAYYRLPGVFANIALVIYATLLFAALKLTPTALSLAGIAGIILSIGMAVDANILIFERTKEELRVGRTVQRAVQLGFDRAFTSIFDSNMTTLITCIILYMTGSGLVKGFAFSLALGVIVSFFTAIVVTRTLMENFLPHKDGLKSPFLFGLSAKELPQQPA